LTPSSCRTYTGRGPESAPKPSLDFLSFEYSFILEGTVGALLGEEEVFGAAGVLIFKARGQWHTFWNAGDTPARILEIISPGGFEQAFRDLEELGGELTPEAVSDIGLRYSIDIDFKGNWPDSRAARAVHVEVCATARVSQESLTWAAGPVAGRRSPTAGRRVREARPLPGNARIVRPPGRREPGMGIARDERNPHQTPLLETPQKSRPARRRLAVGDIDSRNMPPWRSPPSHGRNRRRAASPILIPAVTHQRMSLKFPPDVRTIVFKRTVRSVTHPALFLEG
jgi:hypothetical protein